MKDGTSKKQYFLQATRPNDWRRSVGRATYNLQVSGGFSLVEILVTISIFVLFTSVIAWNLRAFGSRSVLDNLVHEIALTIRQAQAYGVGVRGTEGGFPSYGAFFETAEDKSFVLFADTYPPGSPAGDGKYTSRDTLIQRFSMQRGNFISQLCGYSFSSSLCTELREIHITYVRPNPEGKLWGVSTSFGEAEYSYIKIFVSTADRESTREVTVWSNGQISVQ